MTTAIRLLTILAQMVLRAFVACINFFKKPPNVIGIVAFANLLENVVSVSLCTHSIASRGETDCRFILVNIQKSLECI